MLLVSKHIESIISTIIHICRFALQAVVYRHIETCEPSVTFGERLELKEIPSYIERYSLQTHEFSRNQVEHEIRPGFFPPEFSENVSVLSSTSVCPETQEGRCVVIILCSNIFFYDRHAFMVTDIPVMVCGRLSEPTGPRDQRQSKD